MIINSYHKKNGQQLNAGRFFYILTEVIQCLKTR